MRVQNYCFVEISGSAYFLLDVIHRRSQIAKTKVVSQLQSVEVFKEHKAERQSVSMKLTNELNIL